MKKSRFTDSQIMSILNKLRPVRRYQCDRDLHQRDFPADVLPPTGWSLNIPTSLWRISSTLMQQR